MTARPLLVTGFEPYGGRGTNPACEVTKILHGRSAGATRIVGRTLSVSFRALRRAPVELLDEIDPAAVISLGLWPGEPCIRLERVGLNIADFEIADNESLLVRDEPIQDDGSAGLLATLPLRAIEASLLDAGIPVRMSSSAGTFLCNACLYGFLRAARERRPQVPCGFVHLPYLPGQVVDLLRDTRREAHLELHQRADLSSMALETMVRAVEIAVDVTARHTDGLA